jgi:hypothetical protein
MRWQALRTTTIIGLAALFDTSCQSCQAPVATDTSPGALDVKLIVLDLEPTPSDGKVIVGMQFFSNGNIVQVGTGVANCDGVNLTLNPLIGNAYAERVPLLSPGLSYHFAYIYGSTTTTVDVPAPPRPTITSPAPNQSVARTATVSVTYPPGGGAAVIVGTTTTDGYTEHAEQPDNGTYSNVDMTAEPAGAGSVKLKRIFRPTFSGTAFKSAVGEVTTASADVPVVWT